MSHQSGIRVSDELAKTFADAVSSGNVRILRVSIEKESLVPTGSTPVGSTFENDFEHVISYLEEDKPSYILVRLDDKNSAGEYHWLFMSYVPDNAKIRDKMIYASTRATLTKGLGDGRFTDNLYGTVKDEFTYAGYKKHLAHKNSEAPLTQREKELAEIKAAEAKAAADYSGTTARQAFAPRLEYQLKDEVIEALKELKKTEEELAHNFVLLYLKNEAVELDKTATVSSKDIHNVLPPSDPRFAFYKFKHDGKDAIVFVYSCPSTSKIKERMLYSCTKRFAVNAAQELVGFQVAKKLETSDPTEITEQYLIEEVYPQGGAAPRDQAGDGSSAGVDQTSGGSVSQRIQMLNGASQGGFRRPVAPGRRRPGTTTTPAATTTAAAEN
ncbi:hypothetical protein VTP01DRAFT_6670 [Rhizomucor pusillus]|uniref:uncharacterized protein n=1 Tax=Rhizomucor pusillus TaxID=4840 RepID=UPI0037426863